MKKTNQMKPVPETWKEFFVDRFKELVYDVSFGLAALCLSIVLAYISSIIFNMPM